MATLRTGAVLNRAPEPAGEAREGRRDRDPWFDNIKLALVTLVVIGHSWTLLPHATGTDWAYDFLYAWHIPAFVVITGYLSRGFAWTPEKLWGLVCTVAVPYVVFEAVFAWFRYQVGGVALDDLFTDPHWPMWYLAALFFWRLMTPAFLALSPRVALAVAVPISLGAGQWAGDTFDAARIMGLLPFFVLGLMLAEADWSRLRSRTWAPLGVLGLLAVAAITWFADDRIATEWYYYRSRYDVLEPDDAKAMTIRLVLLGIGLLGAFSFFVIVPRVTSWLTALGPATLVVYLFHGFVVLSAQYQGYPVWTAAHPVSGIVVTTAAAIGLALLLAAPPVARVLGSLVDPVGRLSRIRRGPARTSAPRPA